MMHGNSNIKLVLHYVIAVPNRLWHNAVATELGHPTGCTSSRPMVCTSGCYYSF